jgi:BRCA1 C Terminus (BRCT) domain
MDRQKRKCLSGSKIVCSGLDDTERADVLSTAQELGAEVVTAIHMHDLPHVLIATSVRTEKYKVIV